MSLDGRTAKFVAFQSFTFARRRMIQSAYRFVSQAENRPLAGWHIPGQKTFAIDFRSEVDDTLGGNDIEGWDLWKHRGLGISCRQWSSTGFCLAPLDTV